MNIFEVIKIIEQSESHNTFVKEHPNAYLVHMFCMRDAHSADDWQAGYYNTDSDKITVFDYKENSVERMPEEEAFKEKNYISKLNINDVKCDVDEAMAKAEEILKKNYSAESIVKAIILLQNLPEYGQIWNFTVITMTFHVINIKINALSGEIIKHSRESLMGWKKE